MPASRSRRASAALALVATVVLGHSQASASPVVDDPRLSEQWNLVGRWGVGASRAWEHLQTAGRPGAAGVVVAVLDSGVAYRSDPPYRRSPDFARWQFVQGYDAIDDDRRPHDRSGHGTHVAAVIAQRSDNGLGFAGLAYGARIMPVRVLDTHGVGDPRDIARGIRFAADHGADVINLSMVFARHTRPSELADVIRALEHARRRGAVVVAAAGNSGRPVVPYPARHPTVIAVGATTLSGCGAEYSKYGRRIDLVAPGGGEDADIPGDARCDARSDHDREIAQISFRGEPRWLGARERDGTSMAAPHVAAAAALVIAGGVLGPEPSPAAVKRHLRLTARDLGEPGEDDNYGAGLLDAAAAAAP